MYALADHYIKRGDFTSARKYASRLKETFPNQNFGQEILNYIAQLEKQQN